MSGQPDISTRLSLPWLMAAQAQKHVTHNEALRLLDGLVQAAVESRSETHEPASPLEGQGWVLPEEAEGPLWDGFEPGELVIWQDGAWTRHTAGPGWRVWVMDEGGLAVFDGEAWIMAASASTASGLFEQLGVGTAPDETNQFAAKLNTALWTARTDGEGGTGDLRYTLNKEGPHNVLSLIFQSGWQGKAEMGLVGDDSFALKVSDDGSSWVEALRVDSGTGEAAFPAGIQVSGLPMLRPETLALLDSFTVPVASLACALAYDGLISALIAGGVWDKLNGLWVMWAHDEQAARVNLKQPSMAATNINAMAFTPFRGFTGDGASSYLDTGFNPDADGAGIYTQNSAHLSSWVVEDPAPATGSGAVGQLGGSSSTTGAFFLIPRGGGAGVARVRLNWSSAVGNFADLAVPQGSALGLRVISRVADDTADIYSNGVFVSEIERGSDGVAGLNFGIGRAVSTYSPATHGAASLGAGLTAPEQAVLYHALNAHRHALGAG